MSKAEHEALVNNCAREAYRVHRGDFPWAQEWFDMPDTTKNIWRNQQRASLAEILRTLEMEIGGSDTDDMSHTVHQVQKFLRKWLRASSLVGKIP